MTRQVALSFEPDAAYAWGTVSSTPTRTRGETVDLELIWGPGTVSHSDGTYHDDGTTHGDAVGEYRRMATRLEWTDPVYTGVSHTGVPWVDERLPSRAPISSQIVAVQPAADLQDMEPFWGIITGGEDNSEPPQETRRMTVSLAFLADVDRYADRAALRADIGADAL